MDYVERTVLDSALAAGKAREHRTWSTVEPVGFDQDDMVIYRYRAGCTCGWKGCWKVANIVPDPIGDVIDEQEQHSYETGHARV